MMRDYINVQFQRGALRNYLYGYCLLSMLIFILIFFDVITYKDSNNIYKKFSDKDYTDTIQDIEFAITESNFRIVNRINIGEAIQERKENAFPRNEVILFCNLTIAEEMLKLEPDFINFCPYKITISEITIKIISITREVTITMEIPKETQTKIITRVTISETVTIAMDFAITTILIITIITITVTITTK